jgi:hypothetical protein
MKTLYIIFFISTSIFAQSPIIDIEEYTYKSEIENAYYKDINNYFNDFEGTWLYTNGNTSLKIVLTKETMQYTGKFYTDGITGEYQYIENGLEKRNTLSNTNQYLKGIWSAFLMKNEFHPICENCQPNERRLNISFSDRTRGLHGTFIFKKTIINGQIALVGHLLSDGPGHYDEANPPQYFEMAVPSGNYTFIKQ